MPKMSQADLSDLNQTFEERTPQELLAWSKTVFGDKVVAISAMQEAGSVVCHMISTLKLGIRVLFVDTGVMYQETLDTRDRLMKEYGLDIVTLHPKQTMEDQTQQHGILYLTVEGEDNSLIFDEFFLFNSMLENSCFDVNATNIRSIHKH